MPTYPTDKNIGKETICIPRISDCKGKDFTISVICGPLHGTSFNVTLLPLLLRTKMLASNNITKPCKKYTQNCLRTIKLTSEPSIEQIIKMTLPQL